MRGFSINEKITKKKNDGITILRPLLCFEVVLLHFWVEQVIEKKMLLFYFFESTAVPVFFIISFYFITPRLLEANADYLKVRIVRLIWPLLAWAFIYWLFFKCYFIFVPLEEYNLTMELWQIDISLHSLFFQLLSGHAHLNSSMWYQSVLLCITILAYYAFQNFSVRINIWLALIFLFCLIAQYTGLYVLLFHNLSYEIKYPIGRLFEMTPYAIIGIFLAKLNISDYINYRYTSLWMIIIPAIIVFLLLLRNFTELKMDGYGYPGFLLLVSSTLIFVYFIKIGQYIKIPSRIAFLSKYTMGIYCCHRLVAYLVIYSIKKNNIEINMFIICMIIYMISYILCYTIDLSKNKIIKGLIE